MASCSAAAAQGRPTPTPVRYGSYATHAPLIPPAIRNPHPYARRTPVVHGSCAARAHVPLMGTPWAVRARPIRPSHASRAYATHVVRTKVQHDHQCVMWASPMRAVLLPHAFGNQMIANEASLTPWCHAAMPKQHQNRHLIIEDPEATANNRQPVISCPSTAGGWRLSISSSAVGGQPPAVGNQPPPAVPTFLNRDETPAKPSGLRQ